MEEHAGALIHRDSNSGMIGTSFYSNLVSSQSQRIFVSPVNVAYWVASHSQSFSFPLIESLKDPAFDFQTFWNMGEIWEASNSNPLTSFYLATDNISGYQFLKTRSWEARIERSGMFVKMFLLSLAIDRDTGASSVIYSVCIFFAKIFTVKTDDGVFSWIFRFVPLRASIQRFLDNLDEKDTLFKRLEQFSSVSTISAEQILARLV